MAKRALHGVVVGLVRRTWLVVFVTVIVCSAFAARAVAALVEASYLAPAPRSGSPRPTPEPTPAPSTKPKPAGAELVARNMFCSTCTSEPGPGPADSFDPKAILIATSIGAEPVATLRVLDSDVQGSWGIGDAIPGVGTLDRIDWQSVELLDTTGHRGRLTLLAAADGRKPGAATPDAAAADPFADRVRKIDDTTYEVDRLLVRDLVTGAVKPGGVRMSPVTDQGKMTGLRVFGVRAGTIAAALGLKNADTLQAVNNVPLESANTLLELYAKLDTLTTVQLDGTRAGKPLTLTLRLR